MRFAHSNHEVGDTLYFYDKHMDDYRPGLVLQRIQHHSMVYYVLEVDTGPPINDTYLRMVSEFRVRTKEQLDEEAQEDE